VSIGGETELGTDTESYNSFANIGLNLNLYFSRCKLSLGGGCLTWFMLDLNNTISGYPYRIIYDVNSTFMVFVPKNTNSGFFVNVKHFCNHPVKSSMIHNEKIFNASNKTYYTTENKKWLSNFYGETISTISIGYEFEFSIYHN